MSPTTLCHVCFDVKYFLFENFFQLNHFFFFRKYDFPENIFRCLFRTKKSPMTKSDRQQDLGNGGRNLAAILARLQKLAQWLDSGNTG
jgi:hypothetical protein